MENIIKFLIKQLDKTTALIGLIGLFFQLINWHSGLFFLFVALLFLPEASFSEKFKLWTDKIKKTQGKK
ncbi:MAG: hypothetical protein WCJ58_00995 [bacterium]